MSSASVSRLLRWGAPVVLVLSLACGGETPSSDDELAEAPHDLPPSSVPSGGEELSIYDLELTFIDQDQNRIALSDLRGQPVVGAMFYTNCKSVCPRITADIQRIEAEVTPAVADSIRYVLFSLDPDRDSPGALRDFAKEHKLDLAHWTLLAADEDGVRELAAVLGVKFRPEAQGEFAHSSTIFLIDSHGVIRHRQEGLNESPEDLLRALEAL